MPQKKMIKTTRLTSPEPTGAAKWLQDMWDEARNTQVKTYMENNTKSAVLSFASAIRRAVDKIAAIPQDGKPIVCECYGSYDRTDRWEEDGETENKEAEAFLQKFITRLGDEDSDCGITKYANSKGVGIAARGRRETGCVVFEDGRREPIDPRTGFAINGGVKAIKCIETYYAILTRK
jgi:hypothetical protein